jgi:hypothetical protein
LDKLSGQRAAVTMSGVERGGHDADIAEATLLTDSVEKLTG